MAVLNAQYKHPQSAYSQGLKDLIDSMLKIDPKERPDIHEVGTFMFVTLLLLKVADFVTALKVLKMTDRVLQTLA